MLSKLIIAFRLSNIVNNFAFNTRISLWMKNEIFVAFISIQFSQTSELIIYYSIILIEK